MSPSFFAPSRRLLRCRHPAVWTTILTTLLLTSCGGQPGIPEGDQPPGWQQQAVALEVEGFELMGAQRPGAIRSATWAGTGFWIADDMLVTNAHVALRARSIKGRSDDGETVVVDRIVYIDPRIDTALLRAQRVPLGAPAILLGERPLDPRTLRDTPVVAVGNTGGLGLAFYRGRVINVTDAGDDERIIHDMPVAGGSSGGPVYLLDGPVIGVNHAISTALRMSFAVPGWRVAEAARNAAGRPGLTLGDAFALDDLPVELQSDGVVCLPPDRSLEMQLVALGPTDMVIRLRAADARRRITPGGALGSLTFLLAGHGEERQWSETIEGPRYVAAHSLVGTGRHVLMVANTGPDTTCLSAAIGRVAWERRL